jgi:mono/diheme cytochrome c family protein
MDDGRKDSARVAKNRLKTACGRLRNSAMRIPALWILAMTQVMALPPRDALPLEQAGKLRNYRLHVRFSSPDGGKLTLGGLRTFDLTGSAAHDVAVESAPGKGVMVRVWSDGKPVLGPEELAIPPGRQTPVPSLVPAPGVTVEESWLQALERSDHATILKNWNDRTLAQGREIYSTLCIVCHGSIDKPGSLPTAPPFAIGPFKNGTDPLSLYHTLTHGYGQMTPLPQYTTEEKYAVIHYIRETYFRPHLPEAYSPVTQEYLASLPMGRAFGKPEVKSRPQRIHEKMDFGPYLFWTYEVERGNMARKGLAIRLDEGDGGVSKGRAWMVYDHETLRAATATTGAFIDWRGIAFDGSHGTHTKLTGSRHFVNPAGPGWASPDGKWHDPRPLGLDGVAYGPMPREWMRYEGIHLHGSKVVIAARIGGTRVLESPGWIDDGGAPVFIRDLEVGSSQRPLRVRIAPESCRVMLQGDGTLGVEEGFHVATLPGGAKTRLLVSRADAASLEALAETPMPAVDLAALTRGGARRWPAEIPHLSQAGSEDGAFALDTYPLPHDNPWNSWMRPGGFDFTPDGKGAVIATWNGDVWRVDGIMEAAPAPLTWRRIASGLFQPLGVRYRGNDLFITCRDQIARLEDLNGDGEVDMIACFNSDHQITESFHEFAMGLQTDEEGNFYYAKGARHARPAVVPHHGTLLRVSADGSTTGIIATGFRAPNGVCVNDDGTFYLTDQEGNWMPKNRINHVKPGQFHGNVWSHDNAHDPADSAAEQPVVWITNRKDRSPSELVRVPKNTWGPLAGSLLNLSYGTGKIFVVPMEDVAGARQGAVCELPLAASPTGIMRGRFAPDGSLFVCGMFAWAGNATAPGGFHRIRHLGKPVHLPLAIHAARGRLEVVFSDALDVSSIVPEAFRFKTWSLRRSSDYGSPHLDEQSLEITAAALGADGRSVLLDIPSLRPTDGYELELKIRSADGAAVHCTPHGTIHRLRDE